MSGFANRLDEFSKFGIIYISKEFNKVIAIRVIRPNFDNGLTEEQKNHFTEIDLDDYDKFDYEVLNDGTISDLEVKIRKIIEEVDNNEY